MTESIAELIRVQPPALHRLPAPDDLVIVQFVRAPDPRWLDALREEGVAVLGYIPDNAWLVDMPATARHRCTGLAFVRATIAYEPAMRVDPALFARPTDDAPLRLRVHAAPRWDPEQLAAHVDRLIPRSRVVARGRYPAATLVELEIDAARLEASVARLLSVPHVTWVEQRRPILPQNSYARGILQTGAVGGRRLFDEGLTGAGQIVGQSDSGLDFEHCFFNDPLETVAFELIDPDSPPAVPATSAGHRKVLAYQYHAGSDTVDDDGHGTHVAGTAVGNSAATSGIGPDAGMAPDAVLVFQDVDRRGGFLDVPANLYGFFEAAYNAGARIHTNSWGASTSSYTSDASQVDHFAWDHPDMLFLFSAGNSGPNPGSIGSPATAKNLIAVGMTQTPASGDPEALDSASSRGPTSDGRLKPEVVHVGGYPIRSAQAGTICELTSMGGTSMAAPGVAGGAALLRQYLEEGFYPHGYAASGPARTPSAALLKAMIVNSAVNIAGFNVAGPIPDDSQGWGRVLLDNVVFFPDDGSRLEILNDDDVTSALDGLAVGATTAEAFTLNRCDDGSPLKISLVWTDPPVAPTSGQAWVNDLDLEVVAADGGVYLGNVFDNGVSVTGGAADDRNNVEQVLLPAGVGGAGDYLIHVVPSTVAQGPQPYALIGSGHVSASPAPRIVVPDVVRQGGCDGDPYLDENETLTVSYTIRNAGCGDSGALHAKLLANTGLPVVIAPSVVSLGGLPVGASATVEFDVSLGDTGGACAGELALMLRVDEDAGARWEYQDTQPLRLDPSSGTSSTTDDVESGDQSVEHDAAWSIAGCSVSSGASAWHLGDNDCTGIPRDAASHSLVFEVALAPGETLGSASFVHAFDGDSNSSLADSAHFEIDHDLDGNYDTLASWQDDAASQSMTPAGPFDLAPFNPGRADSVRFRFRFQSAALWVGPQSATGWDVDDFTVELAIVGECDANSKQPPADVGNTLRLSLSGADVVLDWQDVIDAESYVVTRSAAPSLENAVEHTSTATTFIDDDAALATAVDFYDVVAVSGCNVRSAN